MWPTTRRNCPSLARTISSPPLAKQVRTSSIRCVLKPEALGAGSPTPMQQRRRRLAPMSSSVVVNVPPAVELVALSLYLSRSLSLSISPSRLLLLLFLPQGKGKGDARIPRPGHEALPLAGIECVLSLSNDLSIYLPTYLSIYLSLSLPPSLRGQGSNSARLSGCWSIHHNTTHPGSSHMVYQLIASASTLPQPCGQTPSC